LAILIKSGLKRLSLPPLVGFIGLGFLLNLAHTGFGFLDTGARHFFQMLANRRHHPAVSHRLGE
jgi:hypothetical protein